MPKIKLTKDEAIEILDGDSKGSKIVLNELVDSSRWSLQYNLVFELNGKLYETNYSRGATESQDEGPWEYEDAIECVEVEEFEKTVKAYRPVPD